MVTIDSIDRCGSLEWFSVKTAAELLSELDELDEHVSVEAKTASDVGKSLLETICAFSNEPLGRQRICWMEIPRYQPGGLSSKFEAKPSEFGPEASESNCEGLALSGHRATKDIS